MLDCGVLAVAID